MSKKKNTLKDLDEFLKQQAATLAPPAKLSDQVSPSPPRKKEPSSSTPDISEEKIVNDLLALSEQAGDEFRMKLYDIIIRSMDAQEQTSAEDKMLINTALYLKSGENWKDAIREYWRKKA